MTTFENLDGNYEISIGNLQFELDRYLKYGLFGQNPLAKISNSNKFEYSISRITIDDLIVSQIENNQTRILLELSIRYNKDPIIYVRSYIHIILENDKILKIEKSFSRIPTISENSNNLPISNVISTFTDILDRYIPKHRIYREYDPINSEDTELFASPFNELKSLILNSQQVKNNIVLIGLPATGKSTLEKMASAHYITSVDPYNENASWTESFRLNTESSETRNHLEIISGETQFIQRKLIVNIVSAIKESLINENSEDISVINKRIETELSNIILFKSLSLLTNIPSFQNGSLLQFLTAVLSYRQCTPFDNLNNVEEILSKLENLNETDIFALNKMANQCGLSNLIDRMIGIYSSSTIIFSDLDEDTHTKIIANLSQDELERRSVSLHYVQWIRVWQKVLKILLINKKIDVKTYSFKKDDVNDLLKNVEQENTKPNLSTWNTLFLVNPDMLYLLSALPKYIIENIFKELLKENKLSEFVEILFDQINSKIHKFNSGNLLLFENNNSIDFNIYKAIVALDNIENSSKNFANPGENSFNFNVYVNNKGNQYSEINVLRYLLQIIGSMINI